MRGRCLVWQSVGLATRGKYPQDAGSVSTGGRRGAACLRKSISPGHTQRTLSQPTTAIRLQSFGAVPALGEGTIENSKPAEKDQNLAWLKTGPGNVVQSAVWAVPSMVPDPVLNQAQDFANEPKSDEDVSSVQSHEIVEVVTNFDVESGLDNEVINVKAGEVGTRPEDAELMAEDGAQRDENERLMAVEGERREERSVETSELDEPPIESSRIGAQCQAIEPGNPELTTRKIENLNLERKRRRCLRERTEKKAIERKVEQTFQTGKVTSASKLVEEILWPSEKSGRKVQRPHPRSP